MFAEKNLMAKANMLLKRIFQCILTFYFIFNICTIDVYADNGNTIVHLTETGVCYHAADCKHLRQSDIPVTLHYAVVENGFNECDDCDAPVYNGPDPLHVKMDKRDHYPGTTNKNIEKTQTITPTPTPTPTAVVEQKQEKQDNNSIGGIIIICVLVAFFGIPLLEIIFDSIMDLRKKQEIKRQEKEQFEQEKQKYYEMYANKDPIEFVEIPKGSFIESGYPCSNNKKKGVYGNYTVYVGKKSLSVLHLNPKCGGAKLIPVNYCLAWNLRHCKRCATGSVELPQLKWYFKYKEIVDIKSKYNIP